MFLLNGVFGMMSLLWANLIKITEGLTGLTCVETKSSVPNLAPRCRLKWCWCRKWHQSRECPSFYFLRELGSERCKSVWSVSFVFGAFGQWDDWHHCLPLHACFVVNFVNFACCGAVQNITVDSNGQSLSPQHPARTHWLFKCVSDANQDETNMQSLHFVSTALLSSRHTVLTHECFEGRIWLSCLVPFWSFECLLLAQLMQPLLGSECFWLSGPWERSKHKLLLPSRPVSSQQLLLARRTQQAC